jgi:hypothetical protein
MRLLILVTLAVAAWLYPSGARAVAAITQCQPALVLSLAPEC